MKKHIRWILFAGCIVLAAAWISQSWYQVMLIQGRSMEPNYHNLQLVLLEKHGLRVVAQDDVIAFRCSGLSAILVKRVVAVPGQTAVIRDGKLLVDGEAFRRYENETFRFSGLLSSPVSLKEGEYIVIGDNLDESRDSRYEEVGIVSADSFIGRVVR